MRVTIGATRCAGSGGLVCGQHRRCRQYAVQRPHGLFCCGAQTIGAVLVGRIDFDRKADMPILDDDARNLSSLDYIERFTLGSDCPQRVADFSLIQFGSHA